MPPSLLGISVSKFTSYRDTIYSGLTPTLIQCDFSISKKTLFSKKVYRYYKDLNWLGEYNIKSSPGYKVEIEGSGYNKENYRHTSQ